jgi:hypothetical protein
MNYAMMFVEHNILRSTKSTNLPSNGAFSGIAGCTPSIANQ